MSVRVSVVLALAVGVALVSAPMAGVRGIERHSHPGGCTIFDVSPAIADDTPHLVSNGSGFSVEYTTHRRIDVTFRLATRPVAHLLVDDASTVPPANYVTHPERPTSNIERRAMSGEFHRHHEMVRLREVVMVR